MKINVNLWPSKVVVPLFLVTLILASVPGAVLASEPQGKLVILTSFPKETTDPLRRTFLRKHPGTEIEIRHKSAVESVKLIDSMAGRMTVDLYWGAAPDTFEMLRKAGNLSPYHPEVAGIPDYLGKMQLNDPNGFYTGFAASGYGFMWNIRYLNAKRLEVPGGWADLALPEYQGHVAMSSAFRSGATHLVIENILQVLGWENGWRLIQAIGGNLKTVTKTGYEVALGVREGDFGIGVVSDSFAISSRASLYPVGFKYPSELIILPSSVAILKGAPNRKAAEAFVNFLLSDTAQYLLTDKHIARLPIRPEVYASVPDDFPNPFAPEVINRSVDFDLATSISRYALINSLFDVMVTFNLSALQQATRVVREVDHRLRLHNVEQAGTLLQKAQDLMSYLPVDEDASRDRAFVEQFSQERIAKDDVVRQRGIQLENQWTDKYRRNYLQAKKLAEQALKLLDN